MFRTFVCTLSFARHNVDPYISMYVYVYSHLTLNRVSGMEGFCANLNSHLLLIGVVLTALIFSFFSPNFRIGGLFSLSEK